MKPRSAVKTSFRRGHDFFNFVGVAGEALAQKFVAGVRDQDVVFDSNAKIFFGDVDAGLYGDDHAGPQRRTILAGVMNIQADVMTQSVNVILAQRLAVQIFSVRVDVVVGNLIGAIVALLADGVARLEHRERGILRAEYNRINFTLARSELA